MYADYVRVAPISKALRRGFRLCLPVSPVLQRVDNATTPEANLHVPVWRRYSLRSSSNMRKEMTVCPPQRT